MQMNSVNNPIVPPGSSPHLFLGPLIFSQNKITAIEGKGIRSYDRLEKRQLWVYVPSEKYEDVSETNRKK